MAKIRQAIQPSGSRDVQQHEIEHQRRRDAEIHDVGQRIHLHAEFRRGLERAREPPVDAVEKGGNEHHDDGRLEAAFISQPHTRQAGANRQDGDEIRHQQPQRDFADARTAAAVRLEGLEGFRPSL